jgi:hypothetical protein
MGRRTTRIRIDSERLRKAVGSQESWSAYAEKFGVTRQAVCNWLAEGKIPPRALFEIARDLNLSSEVINEILVAGEELELPNRQIVIRISIEESI